ncbi:hypothetical protein BV881_31880 [Streptomyces sp. ZL-24]|uniref:hypothetical protein n=1 Tax=Streptomyces sp. ZL-24 TaxID=1933029 RepID=UPI000CD471F5|nr:hypothetical protein [Streptomyces sp. ZL-24]POG43451.1 hypothetical protein BV881_31880 [Streptomyces sp. ZL-24]
MSYQAQTWVDKVGMHQCKNGGELLVLLRVANHTSGSEMRGCYASAETIAGECLMGESTVLKHLRRLKAGGLLLPGDPGLVSHIRADRRPPVYDLAGGHEPGCGGKHSIDLVCRPTDTGVQNEHPSKETPATGARSEHPQKKSRSAGVRSEHPSKEAPSTGVQIDLSRVFKSSTDSYRDLNSLFSAPTGAFAPQLSQPSREDERETAAPEDNPAPAAAEVPGPRVGQAVNGGQHAELLEMLLGLPGRMHRNDAVHLLPLAAEAMAAGWTAPRLRDHLARRCDPERVYDVTAIYRKHLKRLPAAPAGTGSRPAAAVAECSKCNGSGLEEDPVTFLPVGRCECRRAPAYATTS